MKTITVLTATRAEYGLLRPVIFALNKLPETDVRVVVTGAHLSAEFGLTYQEIENDGIVIDRKIEILLSSDSPAAVSKSMGLAMMGFADYFEQRRPDALLVLGDRYETLAVCCAAMNARIPILHLYGGETTQGAVDEAIRHAITKMSYLHFTSTEEYRNRVIQLGESPQRVFCVGGLGVENALNVPLLSRNELTAWLQIPENAPFVSVTFHPVTLEEGAAEQQFRELLNALSEHPEFYYIITKANADADGRVINRLIDEYAADHENVRAYESLGLKRYLSTLRHCEMVIGNSSSGLLEAPSFHIPTVNVGDRQKGRLKADSVLDCAPDQASICKAISLAKTPEMREKAAKTINPYGDGKTSEAIARILQTAFETFSHEDLKKVFYDLPRP